MPALRTHLVKIGNSHGIRIPKAVIQQIRLIDEVEIEVKRDCLIIKPADNPRANWEKAFAQEKGPLTKEDKDWLEIENSGMDEDWTWK